MNHPVKKTSKPSFSNKTDALVQEISSMTKSELKTYLGVSEKLAQQNFTRFKDLSDGVAKSYPTLYMYAGDVFSQLHLSEYGQEEVGYAHDHLLVLSGLYGAVRAMDAISEYRLEMKMKAPDSSQSLAEFWKKDVTLFIAHEYPEETILNLASQEYSKAIDFESLGLKKVDVVFEQLRKGEYKTFGLLAKRARGAMIDYCIRKQVASIQELREFSQNGYSLFQEDEMSLVFRTDL